MILLFRSDGLFIHLRKSYMILINALSYLLNWQFKSPAFTILGLVLIVIGAKTAGK